MSDRTYRAVNEVVRVLLRVLGVRVSVTGEEHLPAHGPAVVASNHNGYTDFVFVGLAARRRGRLVRFMAKRSVFEHPLAGPLMRAMRHIPVDRANGAPAAVAGAHALAGGELLGLFPEGTISRSYLVKDRSELREGAATLALLMGVPLVPVVHWGGHRLLTADGHFSLRRGTAVLVMVGEPLVPLPDETRGQLTSRLRERQEAMLGEVLARYPQRPGDPASAWWWPAALGGAAPDPTEAARLDAEGVARVEARASARREARARRRRAMGRRRGAHPGT